VKRFVIFAVKLGISALIVWLLARGAREPFERLRDHPKDWWLLLAAAGVIQLAVFVTFYRWYLLVRALNLPFTIRDAFRLGFLGYLLNFVSLGSVGGDLFKAIFVAREQPGRRAEAVATVVIDRIIGLYAVFVVATVAILAAGLLHSPVREIRMVCRVTVGCAAGGAAAIVMMFVPGFTRGAVSRALVRLPKVGHILGRLLGAVRVYRRRWGTLAWVGLISLLVHALNTLGIYLLACGLPAAIPSFSSHFVIVPLAIVGGAVPLPFGGLGGLEFVMEHLYRVYGSGTAAVQAGTGFLVSLGYRGATIVIALVGFVVYLINRALVAQMLSDRRAAQQAEETLEHLGEDPPPHLGDEPLAVGALPDQLPGLAGQHGKPKPACPA
jgi:uncharacterized membrane protein YbhN (UPF0104 family)